MVFDDWRQAVVFIVAVILIGGGAIYILAPGSVRMVRRHADRTEQIEQIIKQPAQ